MIKLHMYGIPNIRFFAYSQLINVAICDLPDVSCFVFHQLVNQHLYHDQEDAHGYRSTVDGKI
jgi:hypothetical protein